MSASRVPAHGHGHGHRGRYRGAISVDAPTQASDIVVTISTGGRVLYLDVQGDGWSCSSSGTDNTCTTNDSSPSTLVAVVKWHPHAQGRFLTATVSSPGNEDPVSGNNSASLTP